MLCTVNNAKLLNHYITFSFNPLNHIYYHYCCNQISNFEYPYCRYPLLSCVSLSKLCTQDNIRWDLLLQFQHSELELHRKCKYSTLCVT